MAGSEARTLIDWHTNLWLPEHMSEEQRIEMNRTAKSGGTDGSASAHREKVAKSADKFVLVTMRFNHLGINVPNEYVADYIKEFPDRAVGFACVDPHDINAPAELERAVTKLGLRGLKASPVYGAYHPWCEEAWRLYEVANALRVPILWHQSAGYAAQSTLENGNPILLDKIARAFPDLRMIVAHVGQPWIGDTVVLLRKHPQIFADLSARYYRKWQFYNAMMLAIDYGVTKQLLFGSDFPVQTTQDALNSFKAVNDWGDGVKLPPIPESVIDDIIYNRPLSLLWP